MLLFLHPFNLNSAYGRFQSAAGRFELQISRMRYIFVRFRALFLAQTQFSPVQIKVNATYKRILRCLQENGGHPAGRGVAKYGIFP